MKYQFLRLFLLFTAITSLVVFNSCEDDDEILRDGFILNEGTPDEFQTNIEIGQITTSNIDRTSISAAVDISELDPQFPVVQHGFVWSSVNQNPTLTDDFNELGALSSIGEVTSNIEGLDAGTTYFIRPYLTVEEGTGLGVVTTFETLPDIVLSVNEGNFGRENGSLSSFSVTTETVDQTVFDADATIQNAIRVENDLYLVTNAPDRLDILTVDGNEITFSNSITSGFFNPIGFARVGNFGYVTNWGPFDQNFETPDPFLAIVDLEANEVIDSIELGIRPQEIIAVDDQLYIANERGSTVTVLDASGSNSTITTEIDVPFGPSIMVVDATGNLWVLCTSGNLVEIDLNTNTVVNTIDGVTVNGFDEKMVINNTGDIIYFLGGTNDTFTGLTNVFEVNLTTASPTAISFVSEGFAFYGIGVDPENGDVYVGDSNAFQSPGTGIRYSSDGTQITTFATGIGPNSFLFL
ncbi:MAG: DUF5074 domain-containing protein [Bacteroidota bacterium]